nr:flagellar motor switch protein FliG [Pantoea dispersa]
MTIGEERAAEVFKHLNQREVQHLSAAMASMKQISHKQLTEVLREFETDAEQFAALSLNSNDYLRSVLIKALGEERASSLLEDILETRETTSGMETLNFMEPQAAADLIRDEHPQIIATIQVHLKRGLGADILAVFDERLRHDVIDVYKRQVEAQRSNCLLYTSMEPQAAADLIRDEHPQIIATILVHLKRGQAADILALFDERLRHDVMLRIATFGGVQPAALAELTEVLNGLLDGTNLKRAKMGGVRTAAEIINLMKTQQEEAVIEAVRDFDGELAQKIIDEMFLFENLVEVDDRSIQRLLQEVESEQLLIALKGAEQPLREKFLKNMSARAADILRDDLANRGPVRMSAVENEQKAILLIVRRLAEAGEMVIGGGEETYV